MFQGLFDSMHHISYDNHSMDTHGYSWVPTYPRGSPNTGTRVDMGWEMGADTYPWDRGQGLTPHPAPPH